MKLEIGTTIVKGDEFKRKRNKVWRFVPTSNIGRPITKLHVKRGFEFRGQR